MNTDQTPRTPTETKDETMTEQTTTPRERAAQVAADWFNGAFEVGQPVRYWTGVREGDGFLSRTRTRAQVLGGHTAVVWVEGHGACIGLTHIQPVVPVDDQHDEDQDVPSPWSDDDLTAAYAEAGGEIDADEGPLPDPHIVGLRGVVNLERSRRNAELRQLRGTWGRYWRGEARAMRRERDAARAEADRLRSDLAEARQKIDALSHLGQLASARELERDEARTELARLNHELEIANRVTANTKGHYARRVDTLTARAERAEDRADKAEAERDAAYAQADRLRTALQRVRGLNQQNLAAVGKAQRRCDAESAEADRLRTELAEAQPQAEWYRTLADHIGALAPDSWDGEDAELSVLCAFVDHLAARVPAEQRERWPDDELTACAERAEAQLATGGAR